MKIRESVGVTIAICEELGERALESEKAIRISGVIVTAILVLIVIGVILNG